MALRDALRAGTTAGVAGAVPGLDTAFDGVQVLLDLAHAHPQPDGVPAMTAAARLPEGDVVIVASRRFGPLPVRAEAFLTFPDGIPGFAGERRFVLLPAAARGVYWLQSADEGSMAFLVVDPFPLFPGYAVDLPADTPDVADPVPPMVLTIVTLPPNGEEVCTANLQAPIVIDLHRGAGRQVILAESHYGPKHAFDLRARLAS